MYMEAIFSEVAVKMTLFQSSYGSQNTTPEKGHSRPQPRLHKDWFLTEDSRRSSISWLPLALRCFTPGSHQHRFQLRPHQQREGRPTELDTMMKTVPRRPKPPSVLPIYRDAEIIKIGPLLRHSSGQQKKIISCIYVMSVFMFLVSNNITFVGHGTEYWTCWNAQLKLNMKKLNPLSVPLQRCSR